LGFDIVPVAVFKRLEVFIMSQFSKLTTLLRKKDGKWAIMLCSGDGIKKTGTLVSAGVPPQVAGALADKLTEAESSLSPAQVEMFSRFKPEDAPRDHPSGNEHHHGHAH
jgi:hypothetical protein